MIKATMPEQKPREITPAGIYLARCYRLIEIGHIEVEDFMTKEKKIKHKLRIEWELPTELRVFNPEKGEQPISMGKEYTLSMFERAPLRLDLISWRGKDFKDKEEAEAFNIEKLLGQACMLNIVHETDKKDKSKVYANISSITTVIKGMQVPPAINTAFKLSYDEWDQGRFDSLPDWLREKMKASQEYKDLSIPKSAPVKESQAIDFNQLHELAEKNKVTAPDDLPF